MSSEQRYVPEYYMITTGTCPSGQVIMDESLCEAAATALSMSDTTITSSSSTYSGRPLGCVAATSSYGSTSLYLQTDASSYDTCSSDNTCLCMPPYGETAPPSPSPTPSPTNPTPVPTPDGYGAKMVFYLEARRVAFSVLFSGEVPFFCRFPLLT